MLESFSILLDLHPRCALADHAPVPQFPAPTSSGESEKGRETRRGLQGYDTCQKNNVQDRINAYKTTGQDYRLSSPYPKNEVGNIRRTKVASMVCMYTRVPARYSSGALTTDLTVG